MTACFALNALSFLVVIYALMSLHVKHIPPAQHAGSMRDELHGGLSYVRHHGSLGRAHRPRGDDDVPRVCGADVPAALRARASSTKAPKPTAT